MRKTPSNTVLLPTPTHHFSTSRTRVKTATVQSMKTTPLAPQTAVMVTLQETAVPCLKGPLLALLRLWCHKIHNTSRSGKPFSAMLVCHSKLHKPKTISSTSRMKVKTATVQSPRTTLLVSQIVEMETPLVIAPHCTGWQSMQLKYIHSKRRKLTTLTKELSTTQPSTDLPIKPYRTCLLLTATDSEHLS